MAAVSPKWASHGWFYRGGVLRETARAFLKEIFLEQIHTEPGSNCWWFNAASANPQGYKFFGWGGKNVMAHRFSYELFREPIPEGKYILHSCDTPPCVNPDHLRPGTTAENVADKVARGRHRGNGFENRTHCPQGHEYTEENVYLFENRRYCRACHTTYSRDWARRNKEHKVEKLREWRRRKKSSTV
jgi:hypothetical protein